MGKMLAGLRGTKKGCLDECKNGMSNNCVYCQIKRAINRLADIENIIGDNYDLDRLRELAQADRDGRCVVLPCKVGDIVYQVETSKCKNMALYKCEDYCYGFGNCWEGESFVKEVKFELWMIACIDKTVFLTREAAEKALEEMEDAQK